MTKRKPHVGEFRMMWCIGAILAEPQSDPGVSVTRQECIYLGRAHGRDGVWVQRDCGLTFVSGEGIFDTEKEALRQVLATALSEIKRIEARMEGTALRLAEIEQAERAGLEVQP